MAVMYKGIMLDHEEHGYPQINAVRLERSPQMKCSLFIVHMLLISGANGMKLVFLPQEIAFL